MTSRTRPTIAVTMGDGAGVGPEVTVAAVVDPDITALSRPLVIGDALRLEQAADVMGLDVDIVTVGSVDEMTEAPGRVNVIDLALLPEDLPGDNSPPSPGMPPSATSRRPPNWPWTGPSRRSAPHL